MYFDNEEEIRDDNEKDIRNIKETMAYYGYTENETPFFDTKNYEKLIIEFIKNKTPYTYNLNLTPRTINFIRKNANKIIINQTESLDRKVLFLEDDQRVIYDFTAEYGKITEENLEQLFKYIRKRAKKREVTNLPIKWIVSSNRNGSSRIYQYNSNDIEMIKKYPIISTGIYMINQNDDLGITVLVHEMIHALVDRHKGIIKNILHDEILSIYFELVSAFELDSSGKLLENTIKSRLQNLKGNILAIQNELFYGEIPTGLNYIDSSLYAFNLFEIYKNSSNNVRNSIKEEINKTLSGERELEETLKVLDVTEEEGSSIMKKHIKTILR